MKTILLPLLLLIFYSSVAQPCADPFNCEKDMNLSPHPINGNNNIIIINYGKQTGMPSTFSDVHYKYGCSASTTSTTCDCAPTDLFYRVFYPTDVNYTTCALPAVIMFHGGGFEDCTGLGNGDDAITICQEFAKKGFVAFDVEYRRGNYNDEDYVTAQGPLAIYRAQQDARGAIRCIIQRQINLGANITGDPYRIDTNNVFLGGSSAGSITAMMCAYYYRQSKIDSILPGVRTALGASINADFYDPDTAKANDVYNDTLDYRRFIKGVLNNWGNVFIHKSFKSNPGAFFRNNDGYKPPVISFHGLKDSTLRIDTTGLFYAPAGANYLDIPGISIHSQTKCVGSCSGTGSTFTVNPDPLGNPDIYSMGSQKIYTILKNAGVATLLFVDCQMKHGLDGNGSSYASNFGTAAANRADTYKYIAARAANFFQLTLHYQDAANHYTGTTAFIECEDKRHLCQTANQNAACSNTDNCDGQFLFDPGDE